MTAPEPSPTTFRLIQIGTAVALLLVHGAAFGSMWGSYGDDALAAVIVGGVISLTGIYLASTSAARIYDPSRTVTLDRYEGGYEDHRYEIGPDGYEHEPRRVYVERKVGEEDATLPRAAAISLTIRGVILGAFGVGLAHAIHAFL